jgi:hypothetical protein
MTKKKKKPGTPASTDATWPTQASAHPAQANLPTGRTGKPTSTSPGKERRVMQVDQPNEASSTPQEPEQSRTL